MKRGRVGPRSGQSVVIPSWPRGRTSSEDCDGELELCELDFLDYALRGGLIGLGAGVAVGAIVSFMPRWTTLPPNTLVVGPGPATGGLELKLRLPF